VLSVEEALDQILSRVGVLPSQHVELMAALGRTLAEPVVARRELPPWPNSSMDGYAVRAADVESGAGRLHVVDRVVAGSIPTRPVAPGEAFRIFTGAPMPASADAVVPQEDVEVSGEWIEVSQAVEPGAFVRPAGEDIRPGDQLLLPGAVIGPAEIGLLATLGFSRVRVYRRPRVAILSTGSELADLGAEPGPGQIPNTNTYSLMAQVVEAGGDPVNLGVAVDDLAAIEERLAWAAACDVLVSSAGVSVGELDFVKEALTKAGAELHLWRVSMRPGKPITFGSLAGRPVFGLPGNPVSAMVTFELFVRPALLKMLGRRTVHRPRVRARALAEIANPGSRRGYLRVRLRADRGGWGADLTGNQGSSVLSSMVLADGLAVIAPDTVIKAGQPVDVIVLRDLSQIEWDIAGG
jgi:molybdopterin molybdotransferase